MVNADEENIIFSTAAELIHNSSQPVFLTGKAGTGKTTFLKNLRESVRKNMVVVAPTGVAAINAGGTTIHSFFQLPFSPYVPVSTKQWGNHDNIDKHGLLSKLRISAERKEIMQELELLVIDEVSMVRCDVLDAIDSVLRHIRNQQGRPFGGVQVLYIGDLYQLPPVVKENEWGLLGSFYETPFFFSSKVISEQPPVHIELEKVYRQSDPGFINLLNKVRNNRMNQEDLDLLHKQYLPGYQPPEGSDFITLTTHNQKADEINRKELALLRGSVFLFDATIAGEFNERAFPADEQLCLKIGAQVMFLKNDVEKTRRYYNGKIGLVEKIEADKIWVKCKTPGAEQLIEVKKETWRNIQYSLDGKTQAVEEKELGSFTQYPLRLAWAITIHKSQGLTFEKAMIDAGNAFAPGQVYVALSRCTRISGIILRSRISINSLQVDERIIEFCSKKPDLEAYSKLLADARRAFQIETIRGLFDYTLCDGLFREMVEFIQENEVFGKAALSWITALQQQFQQCLIHSSTFTNVLEGLFTENGLPEENSRMLLRLTSAAAWFTAEFTRLKEGLCGSPAITDNRQLANDFNARLIKIWNRLTMQLYLLDACKEGFSMEKFRLQKATFKAIPFSQTAYSGKSGYVPTHVAHPDLYQALRDKREELCKEKQLPLYMVCGTLSLELMATYLPQTIEELGKISGFGKVKLRQFGNDFILIIQNYCELNGLQSSEPVLPVRKQKRQTNSTKPDTKKISFDFYKQGKTIKEIALERNLAVTTIEGHIAYFIEKGELDINEFVDKERQQSIRKVITVTGAASLQQLKAQLPEISYGELKWVIASEKFFSELQNSS